MLEIRLRKVGQILSMVGWPSGLGRDSSNQKGVGSSPIASFFIFCKFLPNFKGKFPACANLRETETLLMINYTFQR